MLFTLLSIFDTILFNFLCNVVALNFLWIQAESTNTEDTSTSFLHFIINLLVFLFLFLLLNFLYLFFNDLILLFRLFLFHLLLNLLEFHRGILDYLYLIFDCFNNFFGFLGWLMFILLSIFTLLFGVIFC